MVADIKLHLKRIHKLSDSILARRLQEALVEREPLVSCIEKSVSVETQTEPVLITPVDPQSEEIPTNPTEYSVHVQTETPLSLSQTPGSSMTSPDFFYNSTPTPLEKNW